ncbi:MAG: redox-regulated ATPase YchF [candidate division Zixibacteria bacterium]|nr:redox-regulated ATPase YchF [candidate division Zixibacteria bacterium]
MQIGIIGLPASGKTTFFNALTGQKAPTGDYSKSKEANRAVVKVPDRRLARLAEIFKPKKTVFAEVQYTDIAGMTGGTGEIKKEVAYITALRLVDELVQVVRVFKDENIPHPNITVDPLRDITNANAELLFNDFVLADNNIQKLEKLMKVHKTDETQRVLSVLLKCRDALEKEMFLADMELSPEELKFINGFGFLTLKPQLYVLNISEDEIDGYKIPESVSSVLKPAKSTAVALCAQIAMEISRLDDEDKIEFRETLGIKEPALETVITESYRLLGLISFLTGGDPEVRAWTIRKGMSASEAAGEIHTDIQRGFIRAETVSFDDLDKYGNWQAAKENGKMKLEGKGYIVKDGDVMLFRFNV